VVLVYPVSIGAHRPRGRCSGHEHLVDVAPAPVFARLKRLDDRMARLVEMLCGVFILGTVATSYMSAGETESEMDPIVTHLQTFFTSIAAWVDLADLFDVITI